MVSRSSLVVRSRPRGRRASGLKPDSTEEPPSAKMSHRLRGAEAWRGVCQIRCRPRHLTAIQNYPSQNIPRVASKRDLNITKLNQYDGNNYCFIHLISNHGIENDQTSYSGNAIIFFYFVA
ncbi:hypothetical protein AVEN_262449-1 [Araneus ventricosus]|uniref:Uncharacterized protein n=1 Tax=Araneus ventricosus TaxID=182803 RepID=A0A4Y2HUF2_ARAVE|nr:hypothetical protein AVEN_262449-1 [Araneus ventricosus]